MGPVYRVSGGGMVVLVYGACRGPTDDPSPWGAGIARVKEERLRPRSVVRSKCMMYL